MTAQDTENQVGGADGTANDNTLTLSTVAGFAAEDATGVTDSGEEVEIKAGDEVVVDKADIVDAPTEESAPAPLADAPNSGEKLHAAAVAYIIAARVLGVDLVQYLEAKVKEIAD